MEKSDVKYQETDKRTQAGEKCVEVVSSRPPSPNQKESGEEDSKGGKTGG